MAAQQPAPYPGDTTPLPGTAHLKRRFTNALGQGLEGTLTGTPQARLDTTEGVVTAAPFTVKVNGGLLAVDLPPGTYNFTGNLQGPGGSTRESFTLTVEAP